MARLAGNLWAVLAFSTVVAVASCVAIIAFGAPPKMLVPVAYCTAAIAAGLGEWANRRRLSRP